MRCSFVPITYAKMMFYIISRSIPQTHWDLVFTSRGRYFFFDRLTNCAHWTPPQDLLDWLITLSEQQLNDFFDPEYDIDLFETHILVEEEQVVEEEPKSDLNDHDLVDRDVLNANFIVNLLMTHFNFYFVEITERQMCRSIQTMGKY